MMTGDYISYIIITRQWLQCLIQAISTNNLTLKHKKEKKKKKACDLEIACFSLQVHDGHHLTKQFEIEN